MYIKTYFFTKDISSKVENQNRSKSSIPILILFMILFLAGLTGSVIGLTPVPCLASSSNENRSPNTVQLISDNTPKLPVVPPSIQRIKTKGKLIVAMYHSDVPPFYFQDKDGTLTGVDVHLIKGFGRLLGVEVEFDRTSKTFNDVINKVAERKADVAISKLGMTFSRAMKIQYTDPYILLHQGLLINRLKLAQQADGRHQTVVIQNLRGKLGVIANSSYVDNGKARFKQATIVGYPTWGQVVEAAVKGEVVAAYRDEVEIKKIIRDKPDTALNFLTVVLKDAEDPKAMAVAWDNQHLLSLLNFYIRYLDLDLTANKILDHYDEVIKQIEKKTKLKTK